MAHFCMSSGLPCVKYSLKYMIRLDFNMSIESFSVYFSGAFLYFMDLWSINGRAKVVSLKIS